jgi:hypothetical protein
MRRLCILTPDPSYSENWAPMAEQFRRLFGPALDFRPWTATGDLTGFDLILPLLAWGYQRDPALWYQTLDQWDTEQLPVANPCALLRWNTDKAYLFDLAAKGVTIVPTISSDALCAADIATASKTPWRPHHSENPNGRAYSSALLLRVNTPRSTVLTAELMPSHLQTICLEPPGLVLA